MWRFKNCRAIANSARVNSDGFHLAFSVWMKQDFTAFYYHLLFQPCICLSTFNCTSNGWRQTIFSSFQMRICRGFLVAFATKCSSEDEHPSGRSVITKEKKSSAPGPSDGTSRGPYPAQVAMANHLMKKCFHSELITRE